MTRFSFQNCLFLESFVFPGLEINVSRNRQTQKYFDWKVALAILGSYYSYKEPTNTRNYRDDANSFFLLLLTNPRKRTFDVCRTVCGRKHRNSQQHGCNFERHQPDSTGYGALDSEMKRCSYERRMVKRLR